MKTILRNTIQLGISFMLMFTSTTSASTIISQLLRQLGYNDLGLYTIFLNSFFFGLGGIIAPYYGNKYNSKWLMMLSLACYAFKLSTYVIINFIHVKWFVYTLVLFGASLSGFCACFLWASQGDYLHSLCEREDKKSQKGYYFGLFYRIYSVSNILAGVATTFLLGYFSAFVYFVTLTAIGIASILYLLFFVDKVQSVNIVQYGKEVSSLKVSVITSSQSQEQTNLLPPKKKVSLLDVLKFYPKMVTMLAFIGVIGFVMGFYSSSLGDLISLTLPQDSDVQYVRLRIGIGIILLGAGQIFGGYLSGHNADKMHIQTIGGIGISMYLIVCQFSQMSVEIKNPIFVYFIAFLWGFMHSYIQNWIIVCCSRNYKGRLQSFSINKQFHSLTLCIYQLIVIFGTSNLSILLTIMSTLTIICISALTQLKTEEQMDQIKQKSQSSESIG